MALHHRNVVPEGYFCAGGDVAGGADYLHITDKAAAGVLDAAMIDAGGEQPDAAGMVVFGRLQFGVRIGKLALK